MPPTREPRKTSPRSPKAATKRRGRTDAREETREESVADFRQRADWFWRTRVINPDINIGAVREAAIQHAATLQRFDPFEHPLRAI
jgi:hypothetical protein